MPARSVTVEIRDRAQATIVQAAATLSERFGVTLDPGSIYDGRDIDFLRARELERVANFLKAIAETEPEDSDEASALRKQLVKSEQQVELLRAENASLRAAWTSAQADTSGEPLEGGVGHEEPSDDLIMRAYELYDSDERVHGPEDLEAFMDAWRRAQADVAQIGTEITEDATPVVVTGAEPVDLSKMKRDELDVYALDHGVDDPEAYKTKAELIAAIEAAAKAVEPDEATE